MWNYSINCPVCGQSNSSCRFNEETKIYFCRNVPLSSHGLKRLGESTIGFDMYIDGDGDEKPKVYQSSQELTLKLLYPAKSHDVIHRKLIQHCGLSQAHRKNLAARGLNNAQIRWVSSQIMSVAKGDVLPLSAAGTDDSGEWISGTGMYVLTKDIDDNLMPGQIRLDKPFGKNKYLFTSPKSPIEKRNQFGEIPIQVISYSERPITAIITEGFLKPLISSVIHRDYLFIGLSGGNISKKTLKYTLNRVKERYHINYVLIAGDSNSIRNKYVVRTYQNLAKYLEYLGIEAGFISWGQYGGNIAKDIDEITPQTLHSAIDNFDEI